MAKLNIELDIDYMDEEQNIDEFVRDEIINAATRRVETAIMKAAEERLTAQLSKVEQIVDKRVEEITTKVIDEFLNTQKFPHPKDSWDKNPEMKSIQEILVKKLEASLNRTVDKDGNYTTSSYNTAGTRIEWLTGKLAEKYADEKVKETTKNIKGHIEKYILEKVKGEIMTQLSSEILKNIDFGSIK